MLSGIGDVFNGFIKFIIGLFISLITIIILLVILLLSGCTYQNLNSLTAIGMAVSSVSISKSEEDEKALVSNGKRMLMTSGSSDNYGSILFDK